MVPPTGNMNARENTKAPSTSPAQVRQLNLTSHLTVTSVTIGLTSATFPALSFSNYDLQPAKAVLRNNGHTAKLSTEPAT
jgi:hypothetical protein